MADTNGAYIVIEGAQGVGKTTIAHMVVEKLQELERDTQFIHEPDGDYDATTREIRHITQDASFPMNSRTEALLYNAARSQSLEGVVAAKRAGTTSIADRSYLTTLAVQFYGRNDIQDYQRLNDIIDFAVHGTWPDLTIVLDAPVDTLKQRALARGETDRFDDLDPAMLERIRAGYLWEAKQRNFPVVYATDSLEDTFAEVWRHIAIYLGLEKTSQSDPVALAEVLAKSPAAKVLQQKPIAPNQDISEHDYYVPTTLPDDIQCDYCDDIEALLRARRKLATTLAQHLAREDSTLKAEAAVERALNILQPALPVACEATQLRSLLDNQEHIELSPELTSKLPSGFAFSTERVKLVSISPRNEFDLVPYMLYETLDLPLAELKTLVDTWSYEVKAHLLETYLAHHPQGNALRHVTYEFDCLEPTQTLLELPELSQDNLQLQLLTPRYGYDMPKQVEEADLSDEYDTLFDMSLQLQSTLQARGYAKESQYATLLGHKQRWTVCMQPHHLNSLDAHDTINVTFRSLAAEKHIHIVRDA